LKTIFVAGDVSKGYSDIAFVDESGKILSGSRRFDDTAEGHTQVEKEISIKNAEKNSVRFVVGLESSGGLERNWLRLFRSLKSKYEMEVLLLNPLAVKKYLDRHLHRNINDQLSALGIAEYLRLGRRPKEVPFEPYLEGARTLYRCVKNVISRVAQVRTELQSLLPIVQPELVQFCREGIPQWVLSLLIKYPTAPALARAQVKTVAQLSYISAEKASKLIDSAKNSVASLRDEHTGTTITFLARTILEEMKKVESLQHQLCTVMKDDLQVQIIDSIKGIGIWTAVCVRLEYGDMERFYSGDAAVAFAGTDPIIQQSGDTLLHLGISHQGRKQIRNALYMPTKAAMQFNPVIREFDQRLKQSGKPYPVRVIACMRKLIQIIYACCITGKFFDPNYARQLKEKKNLQTVQSQQKPVRPKSPLSAPISWKEAKKRKAATLPQNEYHSFKRGPGAATFNNNEK
jgi:transposase